MSRFKIVRPSPALVVAVIALSVALGGSAIAASHFIGTSDIENRAVTAQKLASKAVKAGKIDKYAVKTNKVASKAIGNKQLDKGSINSNRLQTTPLWAYSDGIAPQPNIQIWNCASYECPAAVSIVRDSPGRYNILWASNQQGDVGITACSTWAEPNDVDNGYRALAAINHDAAEASEDASTTAIQILDSNDNPVDSPFTVWVLCPNVSGAQ